ncbi:maleylacetate reductase [Phytoactinopolyspora halotolerans]|uniref:Maleylacetate reductase n=1 Tax=Phytoactinopolyspora halotolerans TaxID=1981512 RepID=A0A6L9SI47_9ACTN|nr:maleylacetate reductase [Phytoactinopolyspora halotolerans]NEE04011.1 maleylacetate reductase [Phytoactinopolyspora halotolerans]
MAGLDPARSAAPAGRTYTWAYAAYPARVVFGHGTVGTVLDEVERLGRSRALLLAGPRVSEHADTVAAVLGSSAVARFDGVAEHTPVQVTEQALTVLREHDADCVVAVGGGSTTGLAKALAARTGLDQVILPTTYAGSEMTPVLGETENGVKTTRSSADVVPEAVVYDVDLTLDLPVHISVASGVNAMAHAVEALYAPQVSPLVQASALTALSRIAGALPRLVSDPGGTAARADMLTGAWLAGICLASADMALQHKLCHTLGGSFGLPHAETHAAVLPHVMAYNAPAVPDVMAQIAEALSAATPLIAWPAPAGDRHSSVIDDAPGFMFDLISAVGGPLSLRELGLAEHDVPKAAELATARPYPNPRTVTTPGLERLLHAAWRGTRP